MKKCLALLILGVVNSSVAAQQLIPENLRCEDRVQPIGIDNTAPRLSWILRSAERNQYQTAYQILVSSDSMGLVNGNADMWDSKKVKSAQSFQIHYAGKPLKTAQRYFWKIKVWDGKNKASDWSPIASWQMGLLDAADWLDAQWIAYERMPDSLYAPLPEDTRKDKISQGNVLPLLRKEFRVEKKLRRATAFVSGLGHFDLHINGKKVGDNFLDPGWTKYDKHALYVGFDVTSYLNRGNNAIGVSLGNGFHYIPPVRGRYRKLKSAFGYPKMICRLLMEYEDGTTENITSNNTWKASPGPITFSSIYGGEDYDARVEQPGWDKPGFNDHDWSSAIVVDAVPRLESQQTEPVRILERFGPVSSHTVADKWVYDFSQNASAIVSIRVSGKRGDTIRIYPAELLNEDGTVNQKASGSPYYFQYILKGDGSETWQPRFTYYGFRYAQVEGAVPENQPNPENKPVLHAIESLHMRNAANRVGTFSSSSPLFNDTYRLIDWAIKSNMVSVFTDCPHREKLGWLEQNHLMGASVRYNYDIAALGRKIVRDMIASQTESGLVPEIAPEFVLFTYGDGMFRDSPEWGSSSILLPWYLYLWYGDKQILEEAWPMMKRYLAYLQSTADGHILSQGLGDWYDIGPNRPGVSQLTPKGLTATAIYYHDLRTMTRIAEVLRKGLMEISELMAEADLVKYAFNLKFFNAKEKSYGTGSQTANATALYMNLVEKEHRQAVLENLIRDIQSRDYSLTAGDIGYRFVLRVLEKEGRSDIIFRMNNRSDVPGYGYQLEKGATALTESWQAFANVSNNHFMLGHLMEWFFSGLAGIRSPEEGILSRKFILKPQLVGDLTNAGAEYHSPFGQISSHWERKGKDLEWKLSIPTNTTAEIHLPGSPEQVSEQISGKEFRVKDVRKGRLVRGSGAYHFILKNAFQQAGRQ